MLATNVATRQLAERSLGLEPCLDFARRPEDGLSPTPCYDGGINGEFDSFGGSGVHFIGYTFSGGNGFSATLVP